MTLRMATCGLMESGVSKPSVPVFPTQEADTDEVEEKKTEEDESEDGMAKVESKDMCERHKDKITAQHSDDLRRVFIPVRYSDSCVHLFCQINSILLISYHFTFYTMLHLCVVP